MAADPLAPVPVPRVVLATTPVPARDAEYVPLLPSKRDLKAMNTGADGNVLLFLEVKCEREAFQATDYAPMSMISGC